jgi:Fe-S-cluster containining protein
VQVLKKGFHAELFHNELKTEQDKLRLAGYNKAMTQENSINSLSDSADAASQAVSEDYDITIIKHDYREIFTRANTDLEASFSKLRPEQSCAVCDAQGVDVLQINQPFHIGCPYRIWQQSVLAYLQEDVAKKVLEKLNLIQAYKNRFTCHQCGVCCRFASSEYSYSELQKRAKSGDSFASQFTSIFIPYESKEAAHARFPEIVDSVLAQAEMQGEVHFYHCPYIGEDNRCTIYGKPKRPAICSSYPDTPLTFIYKNCAWRPWKDETHPDALWAHAMIELCSWWIGQLSLSLETSDDAE